MGWVLAAFFVAKWTDFFSVVLTSDRPNRTLLRLAMIGIGINTSLVIYLTIYLPKVKKITDSSAWSVYCPRVIPTMTLVGIVSFLLSLRALWPVWGFLAPLVVGVELMGALFGLHFVPLPNFSFWVEIMLKGRTIDL